MPLTAIRQYADLVRQGTGNEEERLSLLRRHQQHVSDQIASLTGCLDLITFKIRLYEASLAQTSADPLLAPADEIRTAEAEIARGEAIPAQVEDFGETKVFCSERITAPVVSATD